MAVKHVHVRKDQPKVDTKFFLSKGGNIVYFLDTVGQESPCIILWISEEALAVGKYPTAEGMGVLTPIRITEIRTEEV